MTFISSQMKRRFTKYYGKQQVVFLRLNGLFDSLNIQQPADDHTQKPYEVVFDQIQYHIIIIFSIYISILINKKLNNIKMTKLSSKMKRSLIKYIKSTWPFFAFISALRSTRYLTTLR